MCVSSLSVKSSRSRPSSQVGTLFGSGASAGRTGDFPHAGTFRTLFSVHFLSASAYWTVYRFLAVTGFTTHLSPFISYSEVLERASSSPHSGANSEHLQDFVAEQCGTANAAV